MGSRFVHSTLSIGILEKTTDKFVWDKAIAEKEIVPAASGMSIFLASSFLHTLCFVKGLASGLSSNNSSRSSIKHMLPFLLIYGYVERFNLAEVTIDFQLLEELSNILDISLLDCL